MAHVSPEPNSGCWLWTAHVNHGGYGEFPALDLGQKLAHRVAYVMDRGPIPHGLFIDHLCRVRCCVNPSHMELVTHRENTMRGVSISKRHSERMNCNHGHPFDRPSVYGAPRKCRECNRLRAIENRRKRRNQPAERPREAMT